MSRTVHLRNLIVLSGALLFIYDVDADSANRRILPTEVEVQEGQDFQVQLLKVLSDEATCYVKTPLLVSCNLKLSDSENNATCDERLHYWSVNGACGFYVTDVQKQDNGIWKLMSQGDDEKVVDIVMVKVLDKFDIELEEKVEITKGLTYILSFSNEKYCIVQNPHDSPSIIMKDVCDVNIETVSGTDEGTWNAVVGIRGQIEEVVKKINVSVFYEHVKSGYTISSDPDAVHIYCNYIAMENGLNMCRFAISSTNQKGLRLREGMRKGRYEYYGNGLNIGECGLTIRSPEEKDYGIWYCLLDTVDKKPPITTGVEVLNPANFQTHTKREATPARTSTISPVITTENEALKLQCFSSKPLSYCWFSQPNGTIYQTVKPNPTKFSNMLQEDTYWLGNCEILINNAEQNHNGTWVCHMGPASSGVELTEEIHVRISKTPLAAIKKFVSHDGARIIFQCKTMPYVKALTHCRFQSPTGFGININEHVGENNAIEQDNVRYWYSGKSLASGDCGLVVEPASSIHKGNWTCAANIEVLGIDDESFDTIYFSYGKSTSGVSTENNTPAIISIVFGSLGFVIVLGVLIALGIKYKERLYNCSRNQSGDNVMQRQDDVSLNTVPTDVSIYSRPSTSRNENGSRNSESSGSTGRTNNSNNTGSSSRISHNPQLIQTHI